MPSQIPVVLSIAGSDNSAGAGAQADLKTMSALGCYGLTAVTCVVAEVPGKVSAIHAIPPEVVREQIRLSLRAFPVAAIKTGMLFSREVMDAVCEILEEEADGIPLVVDPVMVATSGDRLLKPEAITVYLERLFPRATVVTPNLDEVAVLTGQPVRSVAEMREAGVELAARHGCAWLLKGGHLGGSIATDVLVKPGAGTEEFHAEFVPDVSTHGTGCTTSAAIAAGLAKGLGLSDAVAGAKAFVHRAISNHLRWQAADGETDALHHFAQ